MVASHLPTGPRARAVRSRCGPGHWWGQAAHRHVEHLCALGWDAAMVTEAAGVQAQLVSKLRAQFVPSGELAAGRT